MGTGTRKHNIGVGDRFILVRVGTTPKGIIAIGTIASSIFEKKHWDDTLATEGKNITCVKLKIEHLNKTPFIGEDELKERFPQIKWTPQSSGTTIIDSIAEEIFTELNSSSYGIQENAITQLEQTILLDPKLIETEKKQLILSRIGQGNFRKLLVKYWGECSVTGMNFPSLLIASHIKPWKISNNFERLDIYNGLLLTPTLDRLFDQGFISFNNQGRIIFSSIIKDHIAALNLSSEMKIQLQENHLKYMDYHRENIFIDNLNNF